MKFSEYQNELTEAFDRPAPITARRGNQSFFMIGDTEYMVGLYYDDSKKSLGVDFMHKPGDSATYYYSLAKGNSKDAMTVFATVIAEIKRLMKDNPVNKISFSAFQDSDSSDAKKRFRLYKRMAERFSKELGFRMTTYGDSFTMTRINPVAVNVEEPTGYDTAWGTEMLDLYEVNDAAIAKVTEGDGEWRLNNWNKLIVRNGKVTLTSGPIRMSDAWYDAFYDLEWYHDEEGEQWFDDEQKIAIINGKVWVINDMEITIWPSIEKLELQSDSELSSGTRQLLGY
ncbi:hypothetical protein VH12019_00380 [Vibrio phage VH1_2019]|uniref:Uncharacterized protein n=1 Tax=Vibrio phage VH1_2019 TaxID=2686307 RepID=A0A6B9ST15_9CAUD|nr:hypothetical protein VH12019_00380 [Vibrio phage VH1_2019]